VKTWLKWLLKKLPVLEVLHVRVVPHRGSQHNMEDIDYHFFELGKLLAHGNFATVKEFVIDRADMEFASWLYHNPFDALPDIFPGLRRLALPQHTLIWFDNTRFQLPSTIEVVEIIDSTRLLNGWAKCVLEGKDQLPNLRRIVLWCNHETEPLVPDKKLRKIPSWYDPACGRNPRDVEREKMLRQQGQLDLEVAFGAPYDWVGDEIWNELQEAGIEIVIGEGRKGWRTMSLD
jgi:hypothetical protein